MSPRGLKREQRISVGAQDIAADFGAGVLHLQRRLAGLSREHVCYRSDAQKVCGVYHERGGDLVAPGELLSNLNCTRKVLFCDQ